MISKETDHSNKIQYPNLNKPIKGQKLLDRLGNLTIKNNSNPAINIKDGVEIIDVKAISKDI